MNQTAPPQNSFICGGASVTERKRFQLYEKRLNGFSEVRREERIAWILGESASAIHHEDSVGFHCFIQVGLADDFFGCVHVEDRNAAVNYFHAIVGA